MKRFLLPLLIFLLFILEGTIFQVFSLERYGVKLVMVPHFVVIVIIMAGIFLGRKHGVLYGLVFGLLYDVIYTDMLGVYLFSLGMLGYVSSLSYRRIKQSAFLAIVIVLTSLILLEYFVYGIHLLLRMTTMEGDVFFFIRLLPTLGLNFVVILAFYLPLRKLLLSLEQFER